MTEADFLRTLAYPPRDADLRAAYADWLEERADARHELVRVCERMRRVPVYSDEYWRLKTRRNELRPTCPAEWLAATGYDGSDYDPIFRDGVPNDWSGRWRVVREFTERWYGFPMPDVGGRAEEIRAAEERFGVSLPPSVREYVAFAHDVFPWCGDGLVLRDELTLERMADQPAFSLLILSEGDIHWAVLSADLSEADPRVHTFVLDVVSNAPDGMARFVPDPNSVAVPVSEWMLGYAEAYSRRGSEFTASVDDVERLRRQLEEAFSICRPISDGESRGMYEHPAGILASFAPNPRGDGNGGPGVCLLVKVRKDVPWQAIPEFLWEYARMRHGCGGWLFMSQEAIDMGIRLRGNRPLPPEHPREAVPPMRLTVGPTTPITGM